MKTALERRHATYLRGHWAEHVALALLILKGYRLLAPLRCFRRRDRSDRQAW
jgi:hypothetical protein